MKQFSKYHYITQSLQAPVSFAQKVGPYVDLRPSVWYSSLYIVGFIFYLFHASMQLIIYCFFIYNLMMIMDF